jgi:hypothetical protein
MSHQESPGGVSALARQREKIIMRIPQQVAERVKEAPAQALRAVFSGIGQVLLVADRIKNRAPVPDRARSIAAAPPPKSVQTGRNAKAAVKDETRWRSLDETGNVRLLSDEDVAQAEPSVEAVTTAAPVETIPADKTARATKPAETLPAGDTALADDTAQAAEKAPTADTAPAGETALADEPVAAPDTVPAAQSVPADDAAPATAAAPAAKTSPSGHTSAKRPVHDKTSLAVPNYDELTVASLRARLRNLDTSQVRALLDYEKANAGRAAVVTMFERRIAKLENDEA